MASRAAGRRKGALSVNAIMARQLSNQEIAHLFYQIAEYLQMQEVVFKPRAYERVARAVETLEEPLGVIYRHGGRKALAELPGVGASIAEKLEELVKTGRLRYYETLKRETPVDIEGLSAIEGLGPKTIKVLWQKLRIRKVEELERAARAGKLRTLPRLSAKIEEKILKSVAFQKQRGGRFLIGEALPLARRIEARLKELPQVKIAVVAGSLRRRRETIGDGDILVVSENPDLVTDFFLKMPEVVHVYGRGKTKTMVRLRNGMDFDFRIVPQESFGAALQYFTGNKDHNVALRQIAIKKGWKLNEYGLFRKRKAKSKKRKEAWTKFAGKTESEIYEALELAFIEPEMREMTGEIELARRRFGKGVALPGLVDYEDLLGDLQVQSDWTDGASSIEQLARAAQKAGLSYIAITDHTKRLAMTRGLDEKRLRRQIAEIDSVNRKIGGITILKGTECDILKDGTLDLPDRILVKLDVVGVSIHSFFTLSRAEQTARVVRAITNPHVDILFHPTGRLLGKRAAIDIDMAEIIRAARRTGTILEVNASPERLDLHDVHIRMAVEAGVKIAIDSDAHAATHFSLLEYGVAQARRGWAKKSDVVNTRPVSEMLKLLKKSS